MKNYHVQKYSSENYQLWNEFVAQAKNATFLFHRDFMDYHSDKFQDFSLLIFDDKQNLKAILPANRVGDVLYSHQGLTYGSLVLNQKSKLQEVIEMLYFLLQFLSKNEISKLQLKQLPSIYSEPNSDEIEYLSFILKARLIRRDSLAVLNLQNSFAFSRDRKNGIKRGIKNNLLVKEEDDFELFWNQILIPNLEQKHQAKPVHSLAEIELLKRKFPNNIRQFNVYFNNTIVAGTTIFETDLVAHSQYISGNLDKNELGSLDLLHDYLISNVFKDKKFFDFGISNENQGKNINEGLLYWKQSFDAGIVVQNFYEIETKFFPLLETILI